ncbi:MAG: S8 family serine peptidase [Bacteroidia bacterium]
MNKKYISLLAAGIFGCLSIWAQAPGVNNPDYNNAVQIAQMQQNRKQLAEEKARELGLPIREVYPNGKTIEIFDISPTGMPLYHQTLTNLGAARTLSTDKVWPGGSGGYSLTGQGMTNRLGVWDGGATRTTHQEFQGRAVQTDGATSLNDHATHVAGTMAAGGVGSQNYRGGSYQAPIKCYDWNSDLSEMVTAAQAGMLVSNHSYSQISGWNRNSSNQWEWWGDMSVSNKIDYKYGFYDNICASWDAQLVSYPNYLPFVAAGNDRGEPGTIPTSYLVRNSSGSWVQGDPNDPPLAVGPFDCISGGQANAKNVMTVGAVNIINSGWTKASDVVMSSFSGWGPTDDGRIKPDIVAAGVNINSTSSSGDAGYTTMSGTSMATPNASGSALLIQQHFNNLKGRFMRASTLKGLIIHTADEAGRLGPDYTFGWGLMNTLKAVNTITDSLRNDIVEVSLANNATYTYNIFSDGTQPIRATICWTDRAATALSPSLNPTNKRLVNDLDIRVRRLSDNMVFQPYILDPANPTANATLGDNNTDNVEQVLIETPVQGNYQIVVTHKGNLAQNQAQVFSLIVSGITPKPSVSFTSAARVICAGRTVVYTDQSAGATNRMWYFPGGNPATSTAASPTVTYNLPGVYPVALRISNASGFDSVYVAEYLTVGGFSLPFIETFENNSSTRNLWTVENPNNDTTFRLWPVGGTTPGNLAMGINNYVFPTTNRLDRIVSPPLDLRGYQNVQLTFQHAYTREDVTSDSLTIHISTNCGTTWTRVVGWRENGGGQFATAPDTSYRSANAFVPSKAEDWCGAGVGPSCFIVNLTPWAGNHSVRIRFEQKSNNGNNMFIDNISITGNSLSPVANFYSIKRTVCENEPVQLLDSSRNNPTSWNWIFTGADITGSTNRNPIIRYANAGNYSIKLKVANANGEDSITKVDYITVLPAPSAPVLTANKSVNLCDGDSLRLTVTNASNFVWFKDSMANTSFTQQDRMVKDEGKYFVRTVGSNGCIAQSNIIAVTTSNIPPKPSITKSISGNGFCDGATFTLTSSSSSNNQWLLNGMPLNDKTGTTLEYGDSGTFGLRVGEKGCYNFADPISITKLPRPATSEIIGRNWAVRNTDNDFSIIRGDVNSQIFWTITGGTILFGQSTNIVTVRFGNGSLATVGVFETGANGCVGPTKQLNVGLVNTSVNETTVISAPNAFPIPANNLLNLTFYSRTDKTIQIEVYDLQGKLILAKQHEPKFGTNEVEINTAKLSTGSYIYSLKVGEQNIYGRFIKE